MKARIAIALTVALLSTGLHPAAALLDEEPAALAGRTVVRAIGSGAASVAVAADVTITSMQLSNDIDTMAFAVVQNTDDGPRLVQVGAVLPPETGSTAGNRFAGINEFGGQWPAGDYTLFVAAPEGHAVEFTLVANNLEGETVVLADQSARAQIKQFDGGGVPDLSPAAFVYSGGADATIESDSGVVFVAGWALAPAHAGTVHGVCVHPAGPPSTGLYLPGCPPGHVPIRPEVIAEPYRTRYYAGGMVGSGAVGLGYFTTQTVPAHRVGGIGFWIDVPEAGPS